MAWTLRLAPLFLILAAGLLAPAGLHAEDEKQGAAKEQPVVPERLPGDKSCLDCHKAWNKRKTIHRPASDSEECIACHEQEDESLHAFTDAAQGAQLCLECHDDMEMKGKKHKPVAEGKCLTCHNPHGSDEEKLLRKPAKKLCGSCHGQIRKGEGKYEHGPYAQGMCYVCHNSHASPNPKLLVKTGSELCLACHEQLNPANAKSATWHKPVREDCTSCHSPHATDHKYVLKKPPDELCASCHKKVLDDAKKDPVVHGALTQGRRCVGCHDPHVSSYHRMLRAKTGKLCLACHNKTFPRTDGRPLTNMAKLLEENANHHGPVKELNCEGCHRPHSGKFRLLKKAYPPRFYDPWKPGNYALCFSCHRKEVFLEPKSKLTGFRDGDRNLHFLHVNKERKGRTCRACHETHASRNPHHIRDKTPFGSWDMPLKYNKTPAGGSCAPGCHTQQTYTRGN